MTFRDLGAMSMTFRARSYIDIRSDILTSSNKAIVTKSKISYILISTFRHSDKDRHIDIVTKL